MKSKATGFLFSIFFSALCFSQTPTEAVKQYFQDYKKLGIQGTPQHMHSVELNKLKALLLPLLDIKKTRHASLLRRELFGDVVAYETLVADQASEFVKRMFIHMGARLDMDSIKLAQFDVLGEVKEGSDVHVLARTQFSYQTKNFERLDILTTRMDGQQWRLIPPQDVSVLINSIQSTIKSFE
jgi:hypothetical protein